MFPRTLSTVVANASSGRRFFPYLRPGGIWLNPGQEFVVEGDLLARLAQNRTTFRRLRDVLNADLDQGVLRIVSSGHNIISDAAKTVVRRVRVLSDNSVDVTGIQAPDYTT